VTPSGDGIGFWNTILWKPDEAYTETDVVGESGTTLHFMCDFGSKGVDLCGTIWSSSREPDDNMVLALHQVFGEHSGCRYLKMFHGYFSRSDI
jgi:hypothetical protein